MLCVVVGNLSPLTATAAELKEPSADRARNRADDGDGKEGQEGLRFRLSLGTDQPEAQPTSKLATTTTLSDPETERILNRLGPIKTDAQDKQEFALRDRSLPPPRTGKTISVSFPQAYSAAPPEGGASGPLEVVRFSPEGAVPLAPNLSLTFSQPMTNVSSQEQAAENVPVKVSPQPQGKWRWVGTKTLLFEPDGRFPMATQYSVTVPAGTKSAIGGALANSRMWNFTTPPPALKSFYPADATVQRRDTLMFAEFDQRIDPAAVLSRVRIEAGTIRPSLRLATQAEIDEDKQVSRLTRDAVKDRWLAFRAVDSSGRSSNALPMAADIAVSILSGVPSAEGPLQSTEARRSSFRTFGPMRVLKHECGSEGHCSPTDMLQIEFSNPLDTETFDASQITIDPKIEDLNTSLDGSNLNIYGSLKGRTTYQITLPATLKDEFGQMLGESATLQFKVGPADQTLLASGGDLVVLDPFGPTRYSVYSRNLDSVKVRLYSVAAEDWTKWIDYQRNEYDKEANKQTTPPGRLVLSRTITIRSKPDEMVETPIDLRDAFKDGLGHVIVIVEATLRQAKPNGDREGAERVETWVQRTNIGLDAFVDSTDLIGWATSLKDGAPLAGVELKLLPYDLSAHSGADGIARLTLLPQSPKLGVNLLVARRGNDVAILPEEMEYSNGAGGWHKTEAKDDLRWFVFDDRKLYRPGEEVHVKGWIRRVGGAKGGDVGLLGAAATSVAYTLKDSRSNEVGKGRMAINALGGFDAALMLPATMNLGYATLELKAEGGSDELSNASFSHSLLVAEFRRPEFEVSARMESEGPLFVGQNASVSVTASYFAGGALPEAPVLWTVTATPATFTPPNRDDYTFGKWVPWWSSDNEGGASHSETLSAQTDSSGKNRLRIDFDSVKPARPTTVTAEARVTDVNRQAWAAKTTMLVHPADLYVGLKSERTFVQQGEPLVVQSIVTDLDGTAVAGRIVQMRAVLIDWKQEQEEWKEVETNPQECSVTSGGDAVACTFTTKEGGRYRITATIRDDRERLNESELTLWVAGGKQPPDRTDDEDKVELIPNAREYRAGDTAEILVQSPFYPAEAVMTLRRSGIVKVEQFRFDGPTYTLRVPIEEGWTPNIHVQVDLVGVEPREVPSPTSNAQGQGGSGGRGTLDIGHWTNLQAASASGELNLSIPPLSRKLNVIATPVDKALAPGGETMVNIEARDATGALVAGSEVAVVVVDESVLALSDYKLADPIDTFYTERDGDTTDYHSRKDVVLAMLPGEGFGYGMGVGGNLGGGGRSEPYPGAYMVAKASDIPPVRQGVTTIIGSSDSVASQPLVHQAPIRLRENFNALAVFAPAVRTDANGRAQVKVKLPDNLTRYRVMAVAVAGGKQFGTGESAITARIPLMVRPSAPRFLNFGDCFELPIVVQNQTDSAMIVDLAVRAGNALVSSSEFQVPSQRSGSNEPETRNLKLETITGRRVIVPANDRVEVRIPATTMKAGTARFQIAAVSGSWADAAEIELPVWTPATTEAFATYGEIDEGAITQPVKAPANIYKQFGGLEIETSSTQLQQLTDAFLYLQHYPYECSEQLSSRILSVAALRDVLAAFQTKDLPSPSEIEAAVARDFKRLEGMQNYDGSFGFWKRGDQSWPYLSIHVAYALAKAKQKDFDVPPEMLKRSQNYLRQIEQHIPANYGVEAQRAIIAYALYVRTQLGDSDTPRARQLIAEAGLENLSLESVGWLLSVLSNDKNSISEVSAIRRLLNNRVTETAGTAHFVCSYQDRDYLLLNSDRRADGVILEALITDQPSSDLIPKIVRGLLANRTRGRWGNTQENVFILLALDRYFNAYEKVTPNFVARVWLGNAYAGEQQFKGRSTDGQQVNVPMSYLVDKDKDAERGPDKISAPGSAQNLILAKEGPGRLYYRIGMNYAPLDLNLKAADYGFTVTRSYEALDHVEDVRQDADGTWHVKAGARVRVRLTMVAPARRYHVALVDPMPAGFESLNPELAVTESLPAGLNAPALTNEPWPVRSIWWNSVWFDHQNLRDERAEAFTSLLWEGVYNYSYVARATTPGQFIVPAAKAEEMYHPETFGRGKTDRVVIE
jgi:uncharacterized protein YfaS (alpha-2-macroglobulin family)